MSKEKLIQVKHMNANRFQAYLMFTRLPFLHAFAQEIQYYSNENETFLGVLLFDKIDSDFCSIILARDEYNQFRAIEIEHSIESYIKAEDWLIGRIRWLTSKKEVEVPHGIEKKGINLFIDIIPENKQHPYYKILKNEISHRSAKELLLEIETFFKDIDGNFIEQFQSLNGFDARLWEIYLFCFLTEENFSLDRNFDRPDFIAQKDELSIAIEAVIVDRKNDNPPKTKSFPIPKTLEQTRDENKNAMPLRFGSALFSKLKKEYWKLQYVIGKPLIFAIADFHDDMSMTWSFPAIIDMLYGVKHNFHHDQNGNLIINPIKILDYTKPTGAKVPSGFFYQPEATNVSGVLFSSTATLAKFNRLGKQAGFGSSKCKIIRVGTNHKHDPNASTPDMFCYEVDESCSESWSEGMSLYHNPIAAIPIDEAMFPSIAQHRLVDGQIHSVTPDFHPYFSFSYNVVVKDR